MEKTRIASIFLLLMGVAINTLAVEPDYNPDSKILTIPAVKFDGEFNDGEFKFEDGEFKYDTTLELNEIGNSRYFKFIESEPPKEEIVECRKDQITLEIFNQIKDDMSFEQVNSIIGCEGQPITVDDRFGEFYEWTESLLPQIQITFRNDTIVNKTYQSLGERAIDPEYNPNTFIVKIPTIKSPDPDPDPDPDLVDPSLDSFIHYYDAMFRLVELSDEELEGKPSEDKPSEDKLKIAVLELLAYAENPPKKCEKGHITEERFNKIKVGENVEINENNKVTLDRVNGIIGCTGVIVGDHYLWEEEPEEDEEEVVVEDVKAPLLKIEATFKNNHLDIRTPYPPVSCTADKIKGDAFNKISEGMTLEKVNSIFGCSGVKIMDDHYFWGERENADKEPRIEVTFKENLLDIRTAHPSFPCRADKITDETLNKISEGMTLEKVNSIFGCSGVIVDDHYVWGRNIDTEPRIEAMFKDNEFVIGTKELILAP